MFAFGPLRQSAFPVVILSIYTFVSRFAHALLRSSLRHAARNAVLMPTGVTNGWGLMKRLLGNALEGKTAVPCRTENRADRVLLRTRCRRNVTCDPGPGIYSNWLFHKRPGAIDCNSRDDDRGASTRSRSVGTRRHPVYLIRREPADPR